MSKILHLVIIIIIGNCEPLNYQKQILGPILKHRIRHLHGGNFQKGFIKFSFFLVSHETTFYWIDNDDKMFFSALGTPTGRASRQCECECASSGR